VRHADGTGVSLPSLRIRPPLSLFSIIVVRVPREKPPEDANASNIRVPLGSLRFRCAARQSEGTTSKPAPGSSITPAARASESIACSDSNTVTSPVMSR
jgi:hypothetical protein